MVGHSPTFDVRSLFTLQMAGCLRSTVWLILKALFAKLRNILLEHKSHKTQTCGSVTDLILNQSVENLRKVFTHRLWLFSTLTDVGGEDVLIVDLYLNPIHEQTHVLRGRQRGRPLVLVLILPAVFVLGPTGHNRAALVGAGVTDGAINEVDAVEEVDHVHGHPVVKVLAMGQLHCLLQVQSGVQRRLGLLVQLEALRPGLKLPLGSECPVFVEDLFQGQGHGCMWGQRLEICLTVSGDLFTIEMEAIKRLCEQPVTVVEKCCGRTLVFVLTQSVILRMTKRERKKKKRVWLMNAHLHWNTLLILQSEAEHKHYFYHC